MRSKNSFHTILEAGKNKIKVQTDLVPGEDPFQDGYLFVVTSHGRRSWGAMWGLFYNSTDSIHGGSTPITLIPSPWTLGFNI